MKNKKRSQNRIILITGVCIAYLVIMILFFIYIIHDTYFPDFAYQIQTSKQIKQRFGKIVKVNETFPNFPTKYKNYHQITYVLKGENGKKYKIKFILKKETKYIIGFVYQDKEYVYQVNDKIKRNTVLSLNDGLFRLVKVENENQITTYNFVNAISNKIILKNVKQYYVSKEENLIYMIGDKKVTVYMVYNYKTRDFIYVDHLDSLGEEYIQVFHDKKLFHKLTNDL